MDRRKFLELIKNGAALSLIMPTVLSPAFLSCSNEDKSSILNYSDIKPDKLVDILKMFTETYKKYSAENINIREAMCNNIQWKGIFRPIQDNDIFAGRTTQNPIGFTGQSNEGYLGYYLHVRHHRKTQGRRSEP